MAELKLGTTIGGSVAWHEGNDGSGSGLDADYLDGNHASAFALSGHTHSYLSAESDTLATVTGRGASTATMLTLTGSASSGGGSTGTASIQIQGTGSYQSLELGVTGNYDGMLRTYGNDMKYYAGHWRSTATATENHSHYWYTSKASSTNWTTVKMSLNHDGDLMTLGRHTLGTFPSSTSNSGEAWIGRASDRSAGTMTVQLGGDNTRIFEVVDYAWTTVIFSAGMNGIYYKGNSIYHTGNVPAWITGNQTITLSGDVSGSGATSISTTVNNINNWAFVNTGSNAATNANTINSNGISYYQSGVDNFSGNSSDGALYSQRYSDNWQHQIAGDYREGNIAVRGKNNGTWARWKPIPTLTISDSAPGNETRGDLWWESDTGKLKIWYADANTEQWVDAMPIPDTSTFFSKAGGGITGPVVINSSLTTSGLARIGNITIGYGTYLNTIKPTGDTNINMDCSAGGLYISGGAYVNSNAILHAGNYTSYAVSTTYNSSLNSDSRNSRGVTRLYRRDDNSDYSVQTYWTGSYWRLYGYAGDSGHADTHVGYADSAGSAGSVAWGNVSSRPTALSSFTNDLGNYGGWITGSGSTSGSSGSISTTVAANTTKDLIYATVADNDAFRITVGGASNAGYVEFVTLDDGTEPIYFKQSGVRTLTLLDGSGNSSFPGNITANSDIRIKDNIQLIDNAIDKVCQLRGVTFTRTDQPDKDKRYAGVIAQEVEKVLPEVIVEDVNGIKSVAYGNMVGLLIEAMKEQQKQIEELKAEVKALKG